MDFPASRGIHSREDGVRIATSSEKLLHEAGMRALSGRTELTNGSMALLGLLNRATGFHQGAIAAVQADNPFSAFTLIRGYAENAAALIWVVNHPDDLRRFLPTASAKDRFSIGRLTGNAHKSLPGFRDLYEQLSDMAHPSKSGLLSGFVLTDDEPGAFLYQSKPRFRHDDDAKLAYFWIVELAEVNASFWERVYDSHYRSAVGSDGPAAIP